MQETSQCLPLTHVCSDIPLHLGLHVFLQESPAMLACLSNHKRGAQRALHRGRMNLGARDRCLRCVFVCACMCVLSYVHVMRSIHDMPVMIMMILRCMNMMTLMITIMLTVMMSEMPVMMMIFRCVHMLRSIHDTPVMMMMMKT